MVILVCFLYSTYPNYPEILIKLGCYIFLLCCWQTEKQTDKQTNAAVKHYLSIGRSGESELMSDFHTILVTSNNLLRLLLPLFPVAPFTNMV